MLSFIVIGKNEEWRLERCLRSVEAVVEADCLTDWELLYVDSQSEDDSVALALRYGARTFRITGECNAAIARNIGAREAQGDILFFIDGDMEILPGFLPNVLSETGELVYPFLSGIFNDIEYDMDWQYVRTTRRHSLHEGDADGVEMTTGGLFLISHILWDRVGGMDGRFRRSQDYDLGLRLAQLGIPLHRKSMVLANHYMQQYTIRPDYVRNVRYTALLLRKHWNGRYLRLFVRQQYTTLLLLLALSLLWVTTWLWLLYGIGIAYKTYKQKASWTIVGRLVARDIYCLWSLLFFWPKQPEMVYVEKNNE